VSDAILILNAGSSSIKFSVFPGHQRPSRQGIICEGECEGIGHRVHFTAKDRAGASLISQYLTEGTTHEGALAALLRWLEDRFLDNQLVAAGHRVVHGGSLYTAPVLIDASVIAELCRLIPLAPLHQPHNLAAIAAISKLHPTLPQIACFDTAFHHTQSEVATAFALPQQHAYGVPDGGAGPDRTPLGQLRSVLDELVDTGVLDRRRRDGIEYPIWSTVHGLAVLAGQGPLRDIPEAARQRLDERAFAFIEEGLT